MDGTPTAYLEEGVYNVGFNNGKLLVKLENLTTGNTDFIPVLCDLQLNRMYNLNLKKKTY